MFSQGLSTLIKLPDDQPAGQLLLSLRQDDTPDHRNDGATERVMGIEPKRPGADIPVISITYKADAQLRVTLRVMADTAQSCLETSLMNASIPLALTSSSLQLAGGTCPSISSAPLQASPSAQLAHVQRCSLL